jgi:hypothetical protein
VFVLDRRRQGDMGELSAALWLAERGASVAYPIGHSPHWDLLAELDGRVIRVQVKTSTFWRNDRWDVTLCTRGGNQSWSGRSKLLDPSRFDYLFVHVGDGRRWFIPASEVAGGAHLVLGGPKYACYEVEPGKPLLDRDVRSAAL